MNVFGWYSDRQLDDRRRDQEQPLFRALLIVAYDDNYNLDLKTPATL
jgi:hypothetical protein